MLIIHSNLQLVTLKLQNFSLFLRYSGIYFYKLNLLFQFTNSISALLSIIYAAIFQIAEIFAVVLNKTNDLVIIFKTALFHKISVNSGISNLLA